MQQRKQELDEEVTATQVGLLGGRRGAHAACMQEKSVVGTGHHAASAGRSHWAGGLYAHGATCQPRSRQEMPFAV